MGRASWAMNSTKGWASPPQVPASLQCGHCLVAFGVLQERPGWVKEHLGGHSPEETPTPTRGSQSGLPPQPQGGPATVVPSRPRGAWVLFWTWHLYVAPEPTRDPCLGCGDSTSLGSPEAGRVATLERGPRVRDLAGRAAARTLPSEPPRLLVLPWHISDLRSRATPRPPPAGTAHPQHCPSIMDEGHTTCRSCQATCFGDCGGHRPGGPSHHWPLPACPGSPLPPLWLLLPGGYLPLEPLEPARPGDRI